MEGRHERAARHTHDGKRDRRFELLILFDSTTSLWVALTIAAAAGFVAGFLLGRRRYRS